MNPLNKNRDVATLGQIAKIMPAADVLSFFNNVMEAYREERNLRHDLAKIEATRDAILTEIRKRYELYHMVFDKIFDERKDAIDRHFEIIDRGITSNDKELIVHGLQGLSKIVSSSPFANIQELSKLLESGRKVEI